MTKARSELKGTGYEIFIGVLSILSILNLVLLLFVNEESLDTVLGVMNAHLQHHLPRRLHLPDLHRSVRGAYFFKHFGWADLLASLRSRSSRSCASSGWSASTGCCAMWASATIGRTSSRTAPAARSTCCC